LRAVVQKSVFSAKIPPAVGETGGLKLSPGKRGEHCPPYVSYTGRGNPTKGSEESWTRASEFITKEKTLPRNYGSRKTLGGDDLGGV